MKTLFHLEPITPASKGGDNTLKISLLSPFGGGWGEEKGSFDKFLFN